MATNQPCAETALISIKKLTEFLGVSAAYTRNLMKTLEIPKRGNGYSKVRLLMACGFEAPLSIDAPYIWSPLWDVPAVAKATGQSAKTIGRMFNCEHHDKSFANALHLGPRKRVIFQFEVEAWANGTTPEIERKPELIHPFLRSSPNKPTTKRDSRSSNSPRDMSYSATALFLNPKGLI